METIWCCLLFAFAPVLGQDVLNVCLDGQHHKSIPGPETSLYKECAPWKKRSCCTNETSYSSHQNGPDGLYSFNYNHCGRMSEKCRRHFQKNNCFYECSPNTGPWIVNESISYRNERFRNIPLKASECEKWWNDCKEDRTCKDNWSVGWDWSSGINECKSDQICRPFTEVFPNGAYMCENIYPGDYKVTDDSKPAMVLWFDGETNPNDEVARFYAKEMGLCCGVARLNVPWVLILSAAVLFLGQL